jgi:tetratricopeptide (TPR) repeat protein
MERWNKFFALIPALVFISFTVSASDTPLDQANKYFDMGRYNQAIPLYEKIKATYPGSDWELTARLMTARSYEKTGDIDGAMDEYSDIIKKHSATSIAEEAFFSMARLRALKGKTGEAIKYYDAYIKKYPMGQYRAMALFDIASLYKEKGEEANALNMYGQILKFFPDQVWFYSWAAIYTGHIYFKKKDLDRAIENYQRVINTKDNQMLYTLSCIHRGQAYTEKRDYKTAENIFQNIIKTSGYFTEEALYGLARAEYDSGEYDMAKETLSSLIQLFPGTIWKADAEKKLAKIQKRLKDDVKNELKEELKEQQ